MTPNPKVIQSGEELRNTVHIFLQNDVHYYPVLNPLGECLGLLSELALVKISLRYYFDSSSRNDKVAHHQEFLDEVTWVSEDENLDEVIKTLLKTPTHRVLVKNKKEKLAGIISPRDIVRILTGESKKVLDLRSELEKAKKETAVQAAEIKNLSESLARYKTVFADTPYMMHSVDAQGVIQMANKKIHQVLGYNDGELIGKTLGDLYPKSVQHEAIEGLKRIMDEGFHHTTYSSMLTKNGQKIRVDLASSALRDNQGNFLGTITISREIDSENLLRALHGVLQGKDPFLFPEDKE